MITSQQLQPVPSCTRAIEDQLHLPLPTAPVFERRKNWPVQVTREDPNIENEGQDAVVRLFGRVSRNSREVISYANDRLIPGTASEKMAAKFIWYEDELINDFQELLSILVEIASLLALFVFGFLLSPLLLIKNKIMEPPNT
ncbi:hypothetical protein O181_004584 [Austropuccinia psidii MF-1]|uniref:Uncharacterized protein n=1 Tax=Austropuccinia psidii MF-1 TaxID=1389203 RepID=A0A9Q3BGH4_9BASI|nr:hypothetical protein [Austropuccinia psidii MF-1]